MNKRKNGVKLILLCEADTVVMMGQNQPKYPNTPLLAMEIFLKSKHFVPSLIFPEEVRWCRDWGGQVVSQPSEGRLVYCPSKPPNPPGWFARTPPPHPPWLPSYTIIKSRKLFPKLQDFLNLRYWEEHTIL